jgi:hypothetical protein
METSSTTNLAFRDTDPLHRFNLPQAASNSNRRTRPPPMDLSHGLEQENRVPLAPKKLDRRMSKGGLRGMFTRTKDHSEKGTILSLKEETAPTSATTDSSRSMAPSSQTPSAAATPLTPATPANPAQSRQSRLKSQFRKSVKPKGATGKPSPRSTHCSPRALPRTSTTWDPPPLFQAYPQAIKHATLAASTSSADVILRLSKKNGLLPDDNLQTTEEGETDQDATAKKAEKAKTKHRRQLSGPASKGDWTQKIFILVTSGYILQYAGEGTFDRLPEKMMQLGTESVAFASDAIPGKHWVLQVSQAVRIFLIVNT